MADLTNNMMLDRLPVVSGKDIRRVEKYQRAYKILENSLSGQEP